MVVWHRVILVRIFDQPVLHLANKIEKADGAEVMPNHRFHDL